VVLLVVLAVELAAALVAAVLAAFLGSGLEVMLIGCGLGLIFSVGLAIYDAVFDPDRGSLFDFTPFEYFIFGFIVTLAVLPGWGVGVAIGLTWQRRTERVSRAE
jgi:hypothetical protein